MIVTLQTLVFFREALINALDRILRPYYNKFSLTFGRNGEVSDDDDSDEQIFADFDEEKGVVFYPPVYLQRYAAVSDCLMDERWCGKLEKVVDLGYHDMSFIKYLKEVSGIRCILGVDIESITLHCSSDLVGCDEYGPKRENPLQVTLFQGNAADPDYRLIGCDAVIAIEMIEHMLPQDLDRLIHTVFGFIKPWVAIFTTPNGDFNVLFKAMEKNGLRRWDHFFEWSREQFNDWCSNIVERYPEYSVTCKGIGPGPPGTLHHGCCSQMAVFVSKNYVKQQDLNLDSLALVAHVPVPNNVSTIFSTWESSVSPNEANMICAPDHEESFIDLFSEQQSFGTIILNSLSTFSLSDVLEYQDKTSQCNLDIEAAKNYMFDDHMCWNVLIPRRKNDNQVYMIEDVNRRLNCSTQLVNKFSKATQLLITKNKVDSLVHTREVVAEIRNLTKMLNFNKDTPPLQNGVHLWHNINWGDNAPYWNQYYKVVREYNPPYESKSEESRITELISDEINRMIDSQFDDNISNDLNRMEIPMDHLMGVVAHITNDTEKVKDLLEWDGYEIVDNVLIHSRLVVDTASTTIGVPDDDWLDNDTGSDWDSTDVHSTTLSDGSTMVPDYHARCLRRALDHKVRKLRTMLTADDDITTELDKVVCRLMKLALRTSRGRRAPPPTRWMQCKLLDLLTLTEKAIERRKKYFLESYPMKAITYEDPVVKSQNMAKALEKIKEDDSALKIVDKYRHLVKENSATKDSCSKHYLDLELVDDLSATNPGIEDFEYIERHSPSIFEPEPTLTDMASYNPADEKTKLERTKAWIEDDLESVTLRDINFDDISSGDTEHSTSLTRYYKKSYKKYKAKKSSSVELKCVICKQSHCNNLVKESKKDKKIKDKTSKTKITKKVRKKASNNDLLKDISKKHVSVDYRHYRLKSRKEFKSLQPTASKPIPASLIELCHPELMIDINMDMYKEQIINYNRDDYVMQSNQSGSVAITEKSVFIDIVMDDIQETIAMKRTIGTDADGDPMGYETETLIRSVSNTMIENYFDKHDVGIENDETIFLNDINEPSTSKGIRHVSMDVQCGPATSAPSYSRLSATTSITRMPSIFTAGIKIEDSSTDTEIKHTGYDAIMQKTSTDCCTSTANVDGIYKTMTPRERNNAIKIIESTPDITQSPTTMALGNKTVMKELMTSMMREQEMYMIQELEMFKMKNQNLAATQNQEIQEKSPYKEMGKQKCSYMTSSTNNISPIIMQGQDLTLEVQTPIITGTPGNESHTMRIKKLPGSQGQEPLTLQAPNPTEVQNQESLTIIKQSLTRMQEQEPVNMRAQSPFRMIEQEYLTIQAQSLSKIQMQNPPLARVQIPAKTQEQEPLNTHEHSPSKIEEKSFETIVLQSSTTISGQEALTARIQNSTETEEQKSLCTQRSYTKQRQSPLTVSLQNSAKTQQKPHTKQLTSSNTIQHQEMHTMRVHIPAKRQVQEACVSLRKHDINMTHEQEMYAGEIMREHFIQDDGPDRTNASSPDFLTKHSSSPSRRYDDPGSDSCRSFASFTCPTCCLTSDMPILSKSRCVGSSRKLTRYIRPKLCCGGVQVHSYRDKQISEDIMYQGEWQNFRPKVLTNRKVFNPVIIKKITDTTLKKKVNSKEGIISKKLVKRDAKVEPPKAFQTHKAEGLLEKPNVEQFKLLSVCMPRCGAKISRPIRSTTKAPSKVTMSSVISKTSNSRLVKKSSVTIVSSVKGEQQNATIAGNKYLPYYLKKKAITLSDKKNLNLKNTASASHFLKKKTLKPLRPETVIKCDLLKFQSDVPSSNFLVLRNEVEVEKKSSTNEGQSTKATPEGGGRWIIPAAKRSLSPQSQNSSTCSSPSSIATVRAKNMTSRKHSTSTFKTSSSNSVSENTTPNNNKKSIKRCKTAKMTDKKKVEDKENIPQTSRQINVISKESDKIVKGTFLAQKKEVFIVQLKESPIQLTNKKPKSSVKILKKSSFSEKRTQSPSSSKNVSFESDELDAENVNSIPVSTEISNVVLVIEPHRLETQKQISNSQPDTPNVVNSRLITEWMNHCDESHTSNVCAAMRMLVEEALDFIDVPYDNINSSNDSDTVVLSRDDFNDGADLRVCSSPMSFKTIITSEDNSLQSNLEQAVNQTFGDDSSNLNKTRLTITDLDLMSFKSVTSVSKYSDYLSAKSSQAKLPIQPIGKSSVKEIYERKDRPFVQIAQNSAGAVAIQAFSGFSINGEPIAGDKLDPVNFIDSETGSLAVNVHRQANSEELFVSGRSSGSFESYVLDEDVVVPSWLFQIISEQQEAADEHLPEPMILLPMPEDEYDANGNIVDSVGLSAGAGDGRGMHSDASQDSSGQGTSLSSTATSSEAQSEAIIIDPSAYVSFGAAALQDSDDGSFVVVDRDDEGSELGTSQAAAPTVPDSCSFSHGEVTRRNPRIVETTASDIDADVSSLETDAMDSDN